MLVRDLKGFPKEQEEESKYPKFALAAKSYNQVLKEIGNLEIKLSVEKIEKALENIKLDFKDFCPCDYIEEKGKGYLIIKRRITTVIAKAICEWDIYE